MQQQRIREEKPKPRPRRRREDDDLDLWNDRSAAPRRSRNAVVLLERLRAESDRIDRLLQT